MCQCARELVKCAVAGFAACVLLIMYAIGACIIAGMEIAMKIMRMSMTSITLLLVLTVYEVQDAIDQIKSFF